MNGEGIERRLAMRQFALLAFAPFPTLAPLASASASARQASVAVPAGAFHLERVLTRQLGDGAAIVVTRRWQIAFSGTPGGMSVRGEQIFADVSAPEALAALTAIERKRSASGVFPLTLDVAGQIVSMGNEPQGTAVLEALETGRVFIESLPARAPEREDARAFIAQLAKLSAGAVSRLPRDLFFPHAGSERLTRDVALPDGETGTVSVTTSAAARPGSGLLHETERRISTRVGGKERIAAERWSLQPAV